MIILNGKRLCKGDTIGIISPASADNEKSMKENISYVKNLGFNIKTGMNIYKRYGYLAGSDKERAQDLMEMFEDKDVDMILCYRGGYGSMRILKYLDFDIIKNNPKIFAGFSDITVLLNSIYQKCNIVTFHSPMVSSNLKDETTLNGIFSVLQNGFEPFEISIPKQYNFEVEIPKYTKGILIGGNLSLICSTIGTPYEIDTDNKILFIEDVNEEPYKIDRMLTQLELCGKLEKCAGFILGQFQGCTLPNYERSLTLKQIFEEKIYSLNKPCISKFPAGHGYPRFTLPIGAEVTMDLNSGKLFVSQAVVE